MLPWGIRCSIVYNYVDLVVRNDTDSTFQVFVSVGDRHLEGELRTNARATHSALVTYRPAGTLSSTARWSPRPAPV